MNLRKAKTHKPEYPVSLDKVQDELVKLALRDLFYQIPDKDEYVIDNIEFKRTAKTVGSSGEALTSVVVIGGTVNNFTTTDASLQVIDNMQVYCNIPAGYDAKIEFTCSAIHNSTEEVLVCVAIDGVTEANSIRRNCPFMGTPKSFNLSMIYLKEGLAPGNHLFEIMTSNDSGVGNTTVFTNLERQMIVTPVKQRSV